jgi:flagellar basal-body rod protein FlgG
MLRSLWVAKTGLDSQQTQLDVITNNLANVSTTAYKRQRPVFQDLVYQQVRESGLYQNAQSVLPVGLELGSGSRVAATQRSFALGALTQTSNPLDLAITGDGFFQVNDPSGVTPNGGPFYTRAGNFTLMPLTGTNNSFLATGGGLAVQQPGGGNIEIPKEATTIMIGNDGQVSVYVGGDTTNAIPCGQIGIYTFANNAGLAAASDGLYTVTPGSGPVNNAGFAGQGGAGSIMQSYIEQSNVNVAEELVSLIAAQRAYEITAKSVTASDQMLQRLGQM